MKRHYYIATAFADFLANSKWFFCFLNLKYDKNCVITFVTESGIDLFLFRHKWNSSSWITVPPFSKTHLSLTQIEIFVKNVENVGISFYIFLIISLQEYKAISTELMKKMNQKILKWIQHNTHIVMRWHRERRILWSLLSKANEGPYL